MRRSMVAKKLEAFSRNGITVAAIHHDRMNLDDV
jgi:NOL1/NOP2/fmu family ribosome biogenesis protein